MKDLIKKGLDFTKENPRIIYSLILVFIIPLAIYFNTYFIVGSFQKNLDSIVQKKAVMAENIINLLAQNSINDPQQLQKIVSQIKEKNDEVEYLKIFSFDKNLQKFAVIASSVESEVGQDLTETQSTQNLLAWNVPEGIAFLDSDERGRFWNVTRYLENENGEKTSLVSLSLSLNDSDNLIKNTINRSYLVLFLTIIVVILLVANNARLFGYALTLTKLKEIDQMKDTFISMASHELKAPLTSMKGNIEFFEEDFGSHLSEQGQHYIANISSSIERLGMLVNDILEVSRLEGNRIPINMSEVEPNSLISNSVDEIRPQAIQKGLELNYSPQELPKVKADPDRMKQIVINLISNAIKYTVKGKVDVLIEIKEKKLLITVADTGVGISAEDQGKLFQKFSRVYNEETKTISGTGLGLWISKELAQKMGGDITVESIRGVGSHFTLHLPLV